MTKQDIIIEKLDRIIQLLEGKKNSEPLITFSKANPNVNMSEIKQYEQEIYKELDNKRWINVRKVFRP